MKINLLKKISKLITFILLEISFLNIILIKHESFNDFIVFSYLAIFGVVIFLSIFINKFNNFFPFIRTNFKFGLTILILSSFCFGKNFVSWRNLFCLLLAILGLILIFLGIKYKEQPEDIKIEQPVELNNIEEKNKKETKKNDYDINIKVDDKKKDDKPIF